MGLPREIFITPFEVWYAATGTAFPAVDATPGGSWTKIGTQGNLNYTEDGVTVSFEQDVATFMSAGSTGPVKASRMSNVIKVSFVMWDMSLEFAKFAINNNTVTDTAAVGATAGYRSIKLYQTPDVAQVALLVKGSVSAYGDSISSQFEFPIASPTGTTEMQFGKTSPAAIAIKFTVLNDPSAATEADRFGTFRMEDVD